MFTSRIFFSNLSIETRRSDIMWWGEAEPIAITALDRNDNTQVGTVKNVHFQNIYCTGENGVFIYGNPDDCNISDITFENVSVEITNKTDFPKDKYDLRPNRYRDAVTGCLNGAYVRNAKDISLQGLKVTVTPELEDCIEKLMDVK